MSGAAEKKRARAARREVAPETKGKGDQSVKASGGNRTPAVPAESTGNARERADAKIARGAKRSRTQVKSDGSGKQSRTASKPSARALKAEADSAQARSSGELVFGPGVHTGTLIAFNHLPNTAGGSMRELFRPVLGKERDRTGVGPFELSQPSAIKQLWLRTLKTMSADARQRLRYVAGPQVGYIVAGFDRPAEIYTLLRDPVDLIASAARRLGLDPAEIFAAGLKHPEWCNPQTRSILAGFVDVENLGTTLGPGDDADIWRARLAGVASEYYRFGTRERFLDSARLFAETLPLTRVQMAAINVGPPAASPALGDELVKIIRAANWLDIELYEQYGELPAVGVGRRATNARVSTAEGDIGAPPGSFGESPKKGLKELVRDQVAQLAWLRQRVAELERRIDRGADGSESPTDTTIADDGTDENEPTNEPDTQNKVVRGKDGWLYLAHDTNRVLDQITGRRTFSAEELDQWEAAIRERWSIAHEGDAAYVLIVPPNQHSVYPENLPDGVELSDARPVMQLLERLDGEPEAPFVYPIEEMRRARGERPTYGPKDSHWNDWGAFVGYQALCDALEEQGVALRRLTVDDLDWDEVDDRGDLGIKVSPPETAIQPRARILTPSSRLIFDNRVRNRGRELIYECEAAPSRALIFGDSFGYVAIKYLSETFGRLVYAHLSQIFDATLLEREQPDAVVTIINERFLVQLPKEGAPTLAELVAVKTRRGFLMSEEDARRQKQRTLRGHVMEG
jgi:hypothetical protein